MQETQNEVRLSFISVSNLIFLAKRNGVLCAIKNSPFLKKCHVWFCEYSKAQKVRKEIEKIRRGSVRIIIEENCPSIF